MTDNRPQFASAEFLVSARPWESDQVTSSPKYQKSKGKAENAVQTVKLKASGSPNWRNTPTEEVGTNPSKWLMGHRCKTHLSMAGRLLQPRHDIVE